MTAPLRVMLLVKPVRVRPSNNVVLLAAVKAPALMAEALYKPKVPPLRVVVPV